MGAARIVARMIYPHGSVAADRHGSH